MTIKVYTVTTGPLAGRKVTIPNFCRWHEDVNMDDHGDTCPKCERQRTGNQTPKR